MCACECHQRRRRSLAPRCVRTCSSSSPLWPATRANRSSARRCRSSAVRSASSSLRCTVAWAPQPHARVSGLDTVATTPCTLATRQRRTNSALHDAHLVSITCRSTSAFSVPDLCSWTYLSNAAICTSQQYNRAGDRDVRTAGAAPWWPEGPVHPTCARSSASARLCALSLREVASLKADSVCL